MNTNATAQMVTSGGKGCMKQRLDTDQIAAEAEQQIAHARARHSRPWRTVGTAVYEGQRYVATAATLLGASAFAQNHSEAVKAAIEKAYEQGREDEYQEWIRPNYPIRAAHARKEGDASCPAKQCPNTDTTPQGSKAAPTFNPKGAAAHASDGGVCPNCGVTWDKHSHNCRWRQHASESEKLLPCPFCGSEAVMHDKGQFWVSCSYVGVCPVSLYDPRIHGCTYKEDAIRIWNRRAAHASEVKQAMDAVPFGDEDEADQYHAAHAPTHCPYCNASFLPPNK